MLVTSRRNIVPTSSWTPANSRGAGSLPVGVGVLYTTTWRFRLIPDNVMQPLAPLTPLTQPATGATNVATGATNAATSVTRPPWVASGGAQSSPHSSRISKSPMSTSISSSGSGRVTVWMMTYWLQGQKHGETHKDCVMSDMVGVTLTLRTILATCVWCYLVCGLPGHLHFSMRFNLHFNRNLQFEEDIDVGVRWCRQHAQLALNKHWE